MSCAGTTMDRHRGSALIAALFMIIVVAALGVFAMRIGSNQQQTANLALLISRADAAAYSGLEYAARRTKSNQPCGNVQLINGFSVSITCSPPVLHFVGAVQYRTFQLTSVAVSATSAYGNPDFVQRTMRRVVSEIPFPTGTWEFSGAAY